VPARIDYRWGAGDTDLYRRYAAELIALKPDLVLATAGSIVGAFQQAMPLSAACINRFTGCLRNFLSGLRAFTYLAAGEFGIMAASRGP
jgi:hypothetical protein